MADTHYQTTAWGVESKGSCIKPFCIRRRDTREMDIEIDIMYCGISHHDGHFVDDNFCDTIYPLVPGCEITGKISRLGKCVPCHFQVGDSVGLGYIFRTCMSCYACEQGEEQACEENFIQTFNSPVVFGDYTDSKHTYGGFSSRITVHHRYVVKIPEGMKIEEAGPLMTSGLTIFSTLKYWGALCGKKKVGIVGLGILGQLAVRMAVMMGNHVTAMSSLEEHRAKACEIGAKRFLKTDEKICQRADYLDLIINTLTMNHKLENFLSMLQYRGTVVQCAMMDQHGDIVQYPDFMEAKQAVAGSFLGGMKDCQECLKFCAKNRLAMPVKIVTCNELDRVFESLRNSHDHPFRFVLDNVQSYFITKESWRPGL